MRLVFALLWALVSAPFAYASTEPVKVDAAIAFVVDMSYSMSLAEVEVARESHRAAILSQEVHDAIRLGYHQRIAITYIEFGRRAETKIDWMLIENFSDAELFSEKFDKIGRRNTGSNTSILYGLQEAYRQFSKLPWEAIKKVIDVVGDGNHNFPNRDTTDLVLMRDILISEGVVINGIPIIIKPDDDDLIEHYEAYVVGGQGWFLMPIYSIDQMPDTVRRKLILEMF